MAIFQKQNEYMACLEETIKQNYGLNNKKADAMIRRIKNPGFTHGYCQFSGGGDIYINSKLPSQCMVICHSNEETEDQDFIGVSTFKKIDGGNKQLKYQLYANTILACVETFVEHLPEYDKPIKEIQQISGYGIAITGLGNVSSRQAIR